MKSQRTWIYPQESGLPLWYRGCILKSPSRGRFAMNQIQLSARAYYRALKLARTIADLAGELNITPQHLAEAIQYRPKLELLSI